jgi:hypothetical protein
MQAFFISGQISFVLFIGMKIIWDASTKTTEKKILCSHKLELKIGRLFRLMYNRLHSHVAIW